MTTKTVSVKDVMWKDSGREIDRAHVKELAASIKEVGLINPIAVVALEGGRFEGRAGRHRYEAVKELGEATIDVQVLDLDPEGQRLARIHENLKRLDLDPIERAREYKGFLELRRAQDPKLTQEAVAKELQVSGPELSNTLMLLDQPQAVQDLLVKGELTPGHVEHAIAPLAKKAPAAEVAKFALQVAREKLDVRTAQRHAEWTLRDVEAKLRVRELDAKVGAAKVKRCPACDTIGTKWAAAPQRFLEVKGRVVLECSYYEPHKWFGDTGELAMSPAEQKAVERQKAREKRVAKEQDRVNAGAAKRARVKVERDYSVFFSRATLPQWAHAVLDTIDKELGEAEISSGMLSCRARRGGFDAPRVDLQAVDVEDGNGGKFATRLVVGNFTSLSSGVDHVAEGASVKELRKDRAQLLAFQRKTVKVKQADDDLWPVEVSAFKLGERVRIGAKSDIQSYVGKQGTILAFDTYYGRAPGGRSGEDSYAVLDIAASTKHHPVKALEKIEARPKKGTAKAAKA